MSIVKDILAELWNTELNYKGMRVNIFGIPIFKKYSQRSLRGTVDRLARNGMINKEKTGIILSLKGRKYVEKRIDMLESFEPPKNSSKKKTLLVMFDILTDRKAEREWFRWHLKKFGYIMVQKSVWVGPDPLPEDFKEYVKKINLKDCIKTFKLAKDYGEYKNSQ